MGILYGGEEAWTNLAQAFTSVSGFSFLVFNLLCAPCFAAIGAIKREMNNTKWFWFAICYQCGFAYVISLLVNQFGNLFIGNASIIGLVFATAAFIGLVYMIFFKKYSEATKLTQL
ncbi:MAG: ferrous iron transporter B, partial [Treponema sp.]|nr:ferrous iron transporter B [Treponema sp.]